MRHAYIDEHVVVGCKESELGNPLFIRVGNGKEPNAGSRTGEHLYWLVDCGRTVLCFELRANRCRVSGLHLRRCLDDSKRRSRARRDVGHILRFGNPVLEVAGDYQCRILA